MSINILACTIVNKNNRNITIEINTNVNIHMEIINHLLGGLPQMDGRVAGQLAHPASQASHSAS